MLLDTKKILCKFIVNFVSSQLEFSCHREVEKTGEVREKGK